MVMGEDVKNKSQTVKVHKVSGQFSSELPPISFGHEYFLFLWAFSKVFVQI